MSDLKTTHVLRAVAETPWAILPAKLVALCEVIALHVTGRQLSAEEVAARTGGAVSPRDPGPVVGAVAVVPVFGTIFPRANLMTRTSGATSAEQLGVRLRALLANPHVSSIVLDVDSPGGAVAGIPELAAQIYDARGTKPIVAVANHLAASAAYWIASAADELIVSPSAQVGSIGVIAAHEDVSGALEQRGIRVNLIHAGKHKVEGNPYEPLGEEARAAIQARVDEYYRMFVSDVARGRGVSADVVRRGFGQGRVVGAQEAVRLRMADRVGTLEATVERVARDQARGQAFADLDFRRRRLRAAAR